ncbi:MAG: TauD/TfdA family dioxygenase [Blastocatellia bacterium]|nr:TauD/TfdA family dioxygenase [Blastocatellia bacterium]
MKTSAKSLKNLSSTRRNSITLSSDQLCKKEYLSQEHLLPLVIRPAVDGVDLVEWLGKNIGFIEDAVTEFGGLLFRGFDLKSQDDFEKTVPILIPNLMQYMEGATPRIKLSRQVYTSTEYPADQSIALHNELSYVTSWPMRICFFCLEAAETGGETPIADVRKVFNRIDPEIREQFINKGWMLVRNFGDHLSLPWQTSFRTESKAEVENYFKKAEIDFEWFSDDQLRTKQVRPSVAKHPKTGEMVWFNHIAFWHVSSLMPEVRQSMLKIFKEEELPYNTYYGDGSPIEDHVVEHIRNAYKEELIAFLWEKGDLLVLDNMLVAHGRSPFSGQRKILVSMGEPCSNRGI